MSDFMLKIFTLMDSRVPSDWWDRSEVRQVSCRLTELEQAMEAILTPEQVSIWEQYQDAQRDMTRVDDFALFENTLSLGIELGRMSVQAQ